jgi:TfoX/Sxy family transcriptional regulator of competence genes
MAYSENIARRVREKLSKFESLEEKRMMGGLAFMLNGKMCVGVMKNEMMCRIDPELHPVLVEKPGCRTMDFTHRPMIGYVLVDEAVLNSKADFDYWIDLCLGFNPKAKASAKGKLKV